MGIGAILNTAVQGMQAQSVRVAVAANNMANSDTPGYLPLRATLSTLGAENGGVGAVVGPAVNAAGGVDETGELTGMIEAREGFEANARVFETGASMWDMLMTINRNPPVEA